MILLWCILAATSIGICFKFFPTWKVNSFNAIVINYTTCLILGLLIDAEARSGLFSGIFSQPWFKFDILLGVLFIIGFNLTAYSIKLHGIALPVLMQKMSLLLTVSFTLIIFKEKFSWIEFIGLIIALGAIIMINLKDNKEHIQTSILHKLALLFVLVFSAAIEIVLYYVDKSNIVGQDQMIFTTLGFGIAAIIGWIMIFIRGMRQKLSLHKQDFFAGVLLGLPNYFSVYLILLLLREGWKGSIMYPLLNVSVLLLSAILAVLLFHEPISRTNRYGILCATLAILIIAIAQNLSDWKINF